MNLVFEQVLSNENHKVSEVYKIIMSSGEHMYKHQGLVHWRSPYPIEAIEKNCEERKVYLAKDLETNMYVHTFQLELINNSIISVEKNSNNESELNVAIINKFATLPSVAGGGIGKQSMDFIEEYCLSKGITKICLDVYDKSEHAIRFYKKRGFVVTGTKPTKHFTVCLMEKKIS